MGRPDTARVQFSRVGRSPGRFDDAKTRCDLPGDVPFVTREIADRNLHAASGRAELTDHVHHTQRACPRVNRHSNVRAT